MPTAPRSHRAPAAAFALAALAATVPAQQVRVTTLDGGERLGVARALDPRGLEMTLDGGGTVTVPRGELLAIHGAPPRAEGDARVVLVGGDEYRGRLRAGDSAGEWFVVESRSIGAVRIAVDRLAVMVLRGQAGDAPPQRFAVREGAQRDEAIFFRARRGFDERTGGIHRFTDMGVVFEPEGGEPRLFLYEDLAAVALRDGMPAPEGGGDLRLLTRSGDVCTVALAEDVTGDFAGLRLVGEGGRRIDLPWEEMAALTFLGDDRVFASQLDPVAVRERAALADDGEPSAWPYQRDLSVTGSFLSVGGFCWGYGLGVHAASELVFQVPADATAFCARVGIDDQVSELPVRGIVDVAVLLGDRVLVGKRGVHSGAGAVDLGLVPVTPGALLTLRVEFGAGLDLGDRVDWLHAVFLRRAGG